MKKFTEEQYQVIVDAWESANTYRQATTAVIQTINSFSNTFTDFNGDQALALANPATREWAHDHFVEKEKKYVWTSKEPIFKGSYRRLYRSENGYVSDFYSSSNQIKRNDFSSHLTETEVLKYGYNPEWFDKEEVE